MNWISPKGTKRKISVRALFDWIMGIIYFTVGIFLIFAERFGVKLQFPPQEFVMVFGIIAVLYGLFRCYRGYVSFYPEEE
jgi:hypothetical protein